MLETNSIQRMFKMWENQFKSEDILQSRRDKLYNV